jgi:hypothetical protein
MIACRFIHIVALMATHWLKFAEYDCIAYAVLCNKAIAQNRTK